MSEQEKSVVVLNLASYMTRSFIEDAFKLSGVDVINVRFSRSDRDQRQCQVELKNVNVCHEVVRTLNDKIIPRSTPPMRFKIKYSYYGRADSRPYHKIDTASSLPRPNKAPRYSDDLSLFVNNLSDDVTSESLLAGFATKYQIVSAKVLMRNDGRSKGCGFVRFYSEFELQKSLTEMQHMTGIGNNPIRVRFAYKNPPSKEFGGSYSPSVNPYYPYHNYQNVWVPSSSQTLSTTPQSDYENYYQYPYPYPAATEPITYPYETFEDEVLEEPILEDDVEQVNKQFMEKNEEFYIALEESRWQNVDDIMDPRITV